MATKILVDKLSECNLHPPARGLLYIDVFDMLPEAFEALVRVDIFSTVLDLISHFQDNIPRNNLDLLEVEILRHKKLAFEHSWRFESENRCHVDCSCVAR